MAGASYTFTLTNTCPGGHHVTIAVSGDASRTLKTDRDSIMNGPRDPDMLVTLLLREIARGRTAGQMATVLTNGVTVTIAP